MAAQPPGETKHYKHGTHRARSPAETLERVSPLLPQCGITRVANVTGLDRVGIPVVMVTRPNARSVAVSQGKGIDLDAAKASGVMEALESWHAERVALPLRLAAYDELANESASTVVDVRDLVRSANSAFDHHTPMLWVQARDLEDGLACWVPLETVSTDYTEPPAPGSGYFAATSNGLASGNSYAEALCHALCEVIERDAITLWNLRPERNLGPTGLDTSSVDDPVCVELLERFAAARLRVVVWETTSDIGVTTYESLVAGDADDWADPEYGSGCHPSRAVALARALTEAAQARVSFIAGSRDDIGSHLYEHEARRIRARACARQVDAHRPARRFTDAPEFATDSFAADATAILERMKAAGLDAPLAVDLTRYHDIAHVVRVVAPGLEGASDHEQGDYTPGRRAVALMPSFPGAPGRVGSNG